MLLFESAPSIYCSSMLHNFRTAPVGIRNCVQWSEDNKVLVITGNEISIIDPRSHHAGLPAILTKSDAQDGLR